MILNIDVPAGGSPRRLALIDRDNTLCADDGFVHRVEDLQWLPQALDALRMLRQAGVAVVVVSNQSGIARGTFPMTAVLEFHAAMVRQAAAAGARIDGLAFCPHMPDDSGEAMCTCRKPSPAMLLTCSRVLQVDVADCAMFGDRETDVLAGRQAGMRAWSTQGHGLHASVQDWLATR